MIHRLTLYNGNIITFASQIASAPDGQHVMFIIEGPITSCSASMHDDNVIADVARHYGPADWAILWVRPAYLGYSEAGRVIEAYNIESRQWADGNIALDCDLSEFQVGGFPNAIAMIQEYERQLLAL